MTLCARQALLVVVKIATQVWIVVTLVKRFVIHLDNALFREKF
jgi:hypothetical protein